MISLVFLIEEVTAPDGLMVINGECRTVIPAGANPTEAERQVAKIISKAIAEVYDREVIGFFNNQPDHKVIQQHRIDFDP